VVFDDYPTLKTMLDDENADITEDHVIVLRNAGPKGGPGMPEWGMVPIPQKLIKHGVRDMLRISDARMSGTSYGACVLHVAPEATSAATIALVRTGDMIAIDVPNRASTARRRRRARAAALRPGSAGAALRTRLRLDVHRAHPAGQRRLRHGLSCRRSSAGDAASPTSSESAREASPGGRGRQRCAAVLAERSVRGRGRRSRSACRRACGRPARAGSTGRELGADDAGRHRRMPQPSSICNEAITGRARSSA
jgi:hypothetical protein